MVLVPDVLRQVLGEKGRGAFGEDWPAHEIVRALQVLSNSGPAAFYFVWKLVDCFSGVITTHLYL